MNRCKVGMLPCCFLGDGEWYMAGRRDRNGFTGRSEVGDEATTPVSVHTHALPFAEETSFIIPEAIDDAGGMRDAWEEIGF